MAIANSHRRGFEFVIERDPSRADSQYAIALVETNGRSEHRREVARVTADRLYAAQPALTEALRTSGLQRTTLKPTRKAPLPLAEDAGVRAALALAVITGITKPGRTSRLLDGISRLSREECFYWYAHTLGATHDLPSSRRRLKAFRIFLAEE